jgi:endonuclease/exonuclease/phosphatase family metal-dependent hydrolase
MSEGPAKRTCRSIAITLRDAASAIVVATLLTSLVGLLLRDRVAPLGLLIYLPAIPIALACLLVDLLRLGRTLRGPRFSLSILAILAALLHAPHVVGFRPLDDADPSGPRVRVLQWNIMWAGELRDDDFTSDYASQIASAKPDVLILSEAPARESFADGLAERLGGDVWRAHVYAYYNWRLRYISRIAVLARGSIEVIATREIDVGATRVLRIQLAGGQPLHVMLVDGISGPGDKSRLLKLVEEMLVENPQVDVVAGDFNATSLSTGFDALARLGYRDANTRGLGLRATWPAAVPIYDIDHLLVHARHRVTDVDTFANPHTDHRGQMAEVQLAP